MSLQLQVHTPYMQNTEHSRRSEPDTCFCYQSVGGLPNTNPERTQLLYVHITAAICAASFPADIRHGIIRPALGDFTLQCGLANKLIEEFIA